MSYRFTPYLGAADAAKGKHTEMFVSREDLAKITRGSGYKGDVTDLKSGKRYSVHGYPCGAGCDCAAIAEEIV